MTAQLLLAAVDVNRYQRLGRLDDQRAAGGEGHLGRVKRLELLFDAVVVKDRATLNVTGKDALLVRHDQVHVLGGTVEGLVVVENDFVDVITIVVAQGADDDVLFFED